MPLGAAKAAATTGAGGGSTNIRRISAAMNIINAFQTSTPFSGPISLPNGSDRVMMIYCSMSANTSSSSPTARNITSLTFGNVAYDTRTIYHQWERTGGNTGHGVYFFKESQLSAASDSTLRVTMSGDNAGHGYSLLVSAIVYENVDQTNPILASNHNIESGSVGYTKTLATGTSLNGLDSAAIIYSINTRGNQPSTVDWTRSTTKTLNPLTLQMTNQPYRGHDLAIADNSLLADSESDLQITGDPYSVGAIFNAVCSSRITYTILRESG